MTHPNIPIEHMTIREQFAALAIQGLIRNGLKEYRRTDNSELVYRLEIHPKEYAAHAVNIADALIEALNTKEVKPYL